MVINLLVLWSIFLVSYLVHFKEWFRVPYGANSPGDYSFRVWFQEVFSFFCGILSLLFNEFVKKKGRRGFTWIEGCVDAAIQWFEECSRKSKEQQPVTPLVTWEQTEKQKNQQLENRNGKKSNYMDISIDKPTRLHKSRHGHSQGRETLRKKSNLLIIV